MTRVRLFGLAVASLGLLLLVLVPWGSAPRAATPAGSVPFDLHLVPAGSASPRVATAWERDGILYLSASDFSLLLDAAKFWRAELGRLTLAVGSHEIPLDPGVFECIDSEIEATENRVARSRDYGRVALLDRL